MKNISEALEEFDSKYYPFFNGGQEHLRDSLRNHYKSTLISLLDEVVPNPRPFRDMESTGWNECRRELIKKINDIKK